MHNQPMYNALAIIGFFLTVGLAADQIAHRHVKEIAFDRITRAGRESIMYYVASFALDVFEYIFANRFNSIRFFSRSATYTLLGFFGGIVFLYHFSPSTYVSATSTFRIFFTDNGYGIALGIVPLIIFILCDYVCNGQTRYFLQLMRQSDSMAKFVALGYGDLIVTISFGILSTCLAVLIYSYIFTSVSTTTLNMHIDFKYYAGKALSLNQESEIVDIVNEESDEVNGESDEEERWRAAGYIIVQVDRTDRELKIIESERHFIGRGYLDSEEYKFKLNGKDIVDRGRFYYILWNTGEQTHFTRYRATRYPLRVYNAFTFESFLEACKKFSEEPMLEDFIFDVRGWDAQEVAAACANGDAISKSIVFSPRYHLLDGRLIVTSTTGQLVQHILNSVATVFQAYYWIGGVDILRAGGLVEAVDEYSIVSSTGNITLHAYSLFYDEWAEANAGRRALENGGYPWSTLFTVTLLTSLFIWLALFVALLLYPAARLVGAHPAFSRFFDIENHPFTFLCLVISFYSVLIITLF